MKEFTPDNMNQFQDEIKKLDLPEWVGIIIYNKAFLEESTINELMDVIAKIAQCRKKE